jgi:hypothetical protein
VGVALYITFERPVPGVSASSVDGKAIAAALEELDGAARVCNVRPLSDFISHSADEVAAMADDLGIDKVETPEERWFLPQEGLRVLEALLAYARRTSELAEATTDLESAVSVLRAASTAGTRFHLAVDF